MNWELLAGMLVGMIIGFVCLKIATRKLNG